MSLTCEISGEALAGTQEEVVATPSGHVCIKRLLLAKLGENGGMDPFETIRELPLSEDQLITLQTKSKQLPPPRPQATSLPNLLQLMQTEYDALVLELFDTRKALEETRRELSQALYQNDSAVRVVARLSMERDAARQQLERWNSSVESAPPASNGDAAADEVEEPETKRRKIEQELPLKNDIPDEDLQAMVDSWQQLHQQRKPMLKAAASAAPTAADLAKYSQVDSKPWHKSTCRSVLCMAVSGDLVATGGKDKQVVVYHAVEKVVRQNLSFGSVPTCVDIHESLVVVGDAKGRVAVYSVEDGSKIGSLEVEGASVVDVRVHPTTKHICVAASDGTLMICLLENNELQQIAQFSNEDPTEYSCGALHPDGLLYAAGTKTGQVHMWDIKNKVLASALKEGDTEDAIAAVAFSNNGYHLATAHESATVRFWDLRKQKTLATMNAEKDLLDSVCAISYDDSGKYVAFGGDGGVQITTVKEWGTTASLPSAKCVSGIVWNNTTVVSCSNKERAVRFYGQEA